MKHIFIINPAAGKGVIQGKLMSELTARNLDFYITKGPGDGENFARKMCENDPDTKLRFYACGGDGTLNEAVNGIFGFGHAEAACYPCGSGNDFIRSFDAPAEYFSDLGRQLAGSAVFADLIRYRGDASDPAARYAVNMCNIGFDCNVAANMSNFKKYPFISGRAAYLLAIVTTLLKKEGAVVSVNFDDGSEFSGKVLFTAIGNGAYCGSGLKAIPYAAVGDGLLDVCIVKDLSRRAIIALFKKYAEGAHVSDPRLSHLICYKKCAGVSVKIENAQKRMGVDGDMRPAASAAFEIVPDAIRFSLPNCSTDFDTAINQTHE